jgi:hypothetical protein
MAADRFASDQPDAAPVEQDQLLLALRAELEEYQHLIEEIPGIYEAKFAQQVHVLAQDIQRLLEERQHLQRLLLRGLQEQVDPSALPPPAPAEAASRSFPGLALMRRWLRSRSRWQLVLALAAATLVPAGLVLRASKAPSAPAPSAASSPSSPGPQSAPVGQAQAAQPALRLRARGEVWLKLLGADQRPLFVGTMQPGQQRSFPFTEGLAIRSGRPHLLEIAVGSQPLAPLGPANDFRWRTLTLPPGDRNSQPASAGQSS